MSMSRRRGLWQILRKVANQVAKKMANESREGLCRGVKGFQVFGFGG